MTYPNTPFQAILYKLHACHEGRQAVGRQTLAEFWCSTDRLDWLQWLVEAPAQAQYDAALAPARAQLNAARAQAYAQYDAALAPARAQLNAALAQAYAQYDAATAPARAQYTSCDAFRAVVKRPTMKALRS